MIISSLFDELQLCRLHRFAFSPVQ